MQVGFEDKLVGWCVALSLLVGGIGELNQASMKKLFVYSGMINMGMALLGLHSPHPLVLLWLAPSYKNSRLNKSFIKWHFCTSQNKMSYSFCDDPPLSKDPTSAPDYSYSYR